MIAPAHTETMRTPREYSQRVLFIDTDDVLNDQGPTAQLYARKFREELNWVEEQEFGAFSALRTNPLEHAATWDVRP